jgi:hypothetical protein
MSFLDEKELLIALIILVAAWPAMSRAESSITYPVTCTIPAIPGVNAPLISMITFVFPFFLQNILRFFAIEGRNDNLPRLPNGDVVCSFGWKIFRSGGRKNTNNHWFDSYLFDHLFLYFLSINLS